MKKDFIVVGAGVSGISTALILKKCGYDVTLIEKSHKTAPVIRGFKRKGVVFDTGLHYVGGCGEGEPFNLFLRYLGVRNNIKTIPFDVDGFDLFRSAKPEMNFLFPSGWGRLVHSFCEKFPEEHKCITEYFNEVRKIYEELPFRDAGKEMSIDYVMQSVEGPSLKVFLDSRSHNEVLKCLLSAHTLLYGMTPAEVPIAFHARIVGSYYESTWGIEGGGLNLAEAFDKELANEGVEVLCNKGVERYVFDEGGELKGVQLEGGEVLNADKVIHTLHLETLLDFVPDSLFRKSYRKRINHLEETLSAFIYYGISEKSIEKLDKRNLLYFPEAQMDYPYGHPDFNQRHLFVAPSRLAEEKQVKGYGFTAICPASYKETQQWKNSRLGKRGPDYKQFKNDLFDRFDDSLHQSCGDILGSFKCVEGSTPLSVRDWSNNPYGALYGCKHKVGHADFSVRTKVKNLFLSGQTVVAPGAMGAVLAALITCSTILGQEKIEKELNKCR